MTGPRRGARLPSHVARSADAYVVDQGSAGVLLSSPQALQDVTAAVEGVLRADRSNGYPPPARLVELVDVLRRRLADAVDFRARNPEVPAPLNPSEWVEPVEGLTAAQAARRQWETEARAACVLAHSLHAGRR